MNDTGTEGMIVERVERPAPAESFAQFLMEAMRDPNIPSDKLQIMLQMRREVLADQAKEAYQRAFAEFSAEMPAIERDGMVDLGKGRYPFATYEQMDKLLRPLLSKHGLSLQFWSSEAESRDIIVVHGALIGHGWQRESVYPVPPDTGPGRNALQARGSAQSYAKRYIADLLCNIVRKGKDDDGRGAIETLIDAVQLAELVDLIAATSTNEASFCRMMVTGAASLAEIRQRDFPRLVLALKEKAKKVKK
jgi:hypothetical protein